MNAPRLLSAITTESVPSVEITSVTDDTRKATKESVFVCVCGVRFDGHALADRAYERGCRFFVAQKKLSLPTDAKVIYVRDTRVALALLADAFYEHPSQRLHVIGITGTKGKTTTACLIRGILDANGIPCGYIGTNGILYGNVQKATANTTPDPLTLQRTLREMTAAGMKAVAIEVSSQAILQNRVFGTRFHTTVFTNFSEDHIGPNEHPTLENYMECKHRLFTEYESVNTLWNSDDPITPQMKSGATAKNNIFYSASGVSVDFSAHNIHATFKKSGLGISFTLKHRDTKNEAFLPLIGECNVSNAICAAAIAIDIFKIPPVNALAALETTTVSGRSECYPLPSGAVAVIDYAHNKESLFQTLTSLRAYSPNRLVCLFGSVGERTQLRRRDLATIASALADECILTSDNPGNEPPEKIIDEIAAHLSGGIPFVKIPDRKAAVLYALKNAKNGDIVLLAGKGHETYQLIGNEKLPFSEKEIIEEFRTAAITH